MAEGREMENRTSGPKSFCLDVTHIAFTHLSLVKASHMIMVNFKEVGNAILLWNRRRILRNGGE